MKPRHIHTHNPSFPLYTPKSVCTAALTTWYNFQKRIKKEKPSRFFILFFGCCCPFIFFEGGLFPRTASWLFVRLPTPYPPSISGQLVWCWHRHMVAGAATPTAERGGGVGTSSKPSLFISFSIFFCWKPCFTLSRFWFEKKNKQKWERERKRNKHGVDCVPISISFVLCVCVCYLCNECRWGAS